MPNGGVRYSAQFGCQICEHEGSAMHMLSIEMGASRVSNPLEFSLQQQLLESKQITTKLFRITVDNCIHYRAFLDYENLVWLDHCNGFEVGDQLHSRKTSVVMLRIVYHFSTFLSTKNPATGTLPAVGSCSDKVRGKRSRQWQVTTGRVNLVGSPLTFAIELCKMGETSRGVDCYEKWTEREIHLFSLTINHKVLGLNTAGVAGGNAEGGAEGEALLS